MRRIVAAFLIVFVLVLGIIPHRLYAAATYYAVHAGGNWQTAATWSTVSAKDATRVGNAAAAPTTSDDLIIDDYSGNLTIGAAVSSKTANFTGYTGTLTHGAFTWTSAGSITLVPTMTYSPSTTNNASKITIAAAGTFTSGGQLITAFRCDTSGAVLLGDNLAFTASKVGLLELSNNGFNVNGKTISGNSAINRVLVSGVTLGTPQTITNALSTTFDNVDFRDITFTTAGALDLTNGGTKLIGDAGGNTASGGALTLTTSRNCNFKTAAGGNWADVANWDTTTDTDRVPLPQDDVTFATAFNSGVTITANMPRLGRSIDFSGASATGAGVLPSFATSAMTSYGSVNLTGLKAGGFSGSGTWTFENQARTGTLSLTSNGQSITNSVSIFLCNFQLNDALTVTNTGGGIALDASTFTSNNFSISAIYFAYSNTPPTAITLGTSTVTCTRTSSNAFAVGAATTVSASDSTIVISDTGANSKTFQGNGKTYGRLSITGGGTGAVIISGSNTFTQGITVNAPKTLTLTAGTNQNVGSFTATGSAGNIITLNATAGTVPTLTKTGGGVVNLDYVSVQGVNVTPANTWYYGTHSVFPGVGLNFQGQASSGDYVQIANSANNQWYQSTAYSTETWITSRSIGGASIGFLYYKTDATPTVGSSFRTGASNFFYNVMNTGFAAVTNNNPLVLNTLQHIVVSWNATTAPKVYVNGTECAYSTSTAFTTPGDDTGQVLIIGNTTARTRTWDGQILSQRYYRNVALSAPNVSTLYAAGPKAVNPLGNATAEYLFNEGTGATLTDSIAGNNGTITGALWANLGWNSGVGTEFMTMMISD